jgi:hypothetical protein
MFSACACDGMSVLSFVICLIGLPHDLQSWAVSVFFHLDHFTPAIFTARSLNSIPNKKLPDLPTSGKLGPQMHRCIKSRVTLLIGECRATMKTSHLPSWALKKHSDQTQSHFFKLPTEIRRRIYDEYFKTGKKQWVKGCFSETAPIALAACHALRPP